MAKAKILEHVNAVHSDIYLKCLSPMQISYFIVKLFGTSGD